MPSGADTAESLRARAIALRNVARKLDGANLLDLHQRAGSDAWQGATPRRCHEELLSARQTVLNAADDLRRSALALDNRATQLSAAGLASSR